jgi:hypothetical protein
MRRGASSEPTQRTTAGSGTPVAGSRTGAAHHGFGDVDRLPTEVGRDVRTAALEAGRLECRVSIADELHLVPEEGERNEVLGPDDVDGEIRLRRHNTDAAGQIDQVWQVPPAGGEAEVVTVERLRWTTAIDHGYSHASRAHGRSGPAAETAVPPCLANRSLVW